MVDVCQAGCSAGPGDCLYLDGYLVVVGGHSYKNVGMVVVLTV